MSILLAHAISPLPAFERELADAKRRAKIESMLVDFTHALQISKSELLERVLSIANPANSDSAECDDKKTNEVPAKESKSAGLQIALNIKYEGGELHSDFNLNGMKIHQHQWHSLNGNIFNSSGEPGSGYLQASILHAQLLQCISQACSSDASSVEG